MPAETKTLIDELGQVTKQARDIVTEFEGKQIPAEKRAEFDKLHKRALEIKVAIEEAQGFEEKQKDIAAAADWLRRPQPTVPLTTGPSAAGGEGRKALTDRGWEFKAGMWHAPTSRPLPDLLGGRALRRSAREGIA